MLTVEQSFTLWSTSWPGALQLILHTFLHPQWRPTNYILYYSSSSPVVAAAV